MNKLGSVYGIFDKQQTWLLYRFNLYNSDFWPFLIKIPIFWSWYTPKICINSDFLAIFDQNSDFLACLEPIYRFFKISSSQVWVSQVYFFIAQWARVSQISMISSNLHDQADLVKIMCKNDCDFFEKHSNIFRPYSGHF